MPGRARGYELYRLESYFIHSAQKYWSPSYHKCGFMSVQQKQPSDLNYRIFNCLNNQLSHLNCFPFSALLAKVVHSGCRGLRYTVNVC